MYILVISRIYIDIKDTRHKRVVFLPVDYITVIMSGATEQGEAGGTGPLRNFMGGDPPKKT